MRTTFAAVLMAGAAAFAAPTAQAADIFFPPVIEIPDVDAGLGGAFYLRGSVALGAHGAHHARHPQVGTGVDLSVTRWGGGMSAGVGVGYELGNGVRFDVTADNFTSDGMTGTVEAGTPSLAAGPHSLNLRSTIVLANAYYDYYLDGKGPGKGTFVYGGAGVGFANNYYVHTTTPGGDPDLVGHNLTPAAAIMAGFGVDYGDLVADIGYRGIYINSIRNDATTYPYEINHSLAHEIRGTVRYRFN